MILDHQELGTLKLLILAFLILNFLASGIIPVQQKMVLKLFILELKKVNFIL